MSRDEQLAARGRRVLKVASFDGFAVSISPPPCDKYIKLVGII